MYIQFFYWRVGLCFDKLNVHSDYVVRIVELQRQLLP